jgi:hypothetical protein
MKENYFTEVSLIFNIILEYINALVSSWHSFYIHCPGTSYFYLVNSISLVFQVTEFNRTLHSSLMTKAETALKTLVYLLFNHRMWLLARETLEEAILLLFVRA